MNGDVQAACARARVVEFELGRGLAEVVPVRRAVRRRVDVGVDDDRVLRELLRGASDASGGVDGSATINGNGGNDGDGSRNGACEQSPE